MKHRIKVSKDRNYIILKVIGEIKAENMMNFIIEAHALGKEKHINRYLVDVTEAVNIDSVISNYKFAYSDMKKAEGIDKLALVAALVSPGDHSHDFIETVLSNAGMFLKIFSDPAKAKEYLLKN